MILSTYAIHFCFGGSSNPPVSLTQKNSLHANQTSLFPTTFHFLYQPSHPRFPTTYSGTRKSSPRPMPVGSHKKPPHILACRPRPFQPSRQAAALLHRSHSHSQCIWWHRFGFNHTFLGSKMLGKEWDIPPSPHPGLNVNKLQVLLEKAAEEEDNNATESDAKWCKIWVSLCSSHGSSGNGFGIKQRGRWSFFPQKYMKKSWTTQERPWIKNQVVNQKCVCRLVTD